MEWNYYNHAMIPNCAPHEVVDLVELKNGSIWRTNSGKIPLLARWTTEFDCGCETAWWYIIKESPYSVDLLSKSTRKHIRHSLKKCTCQIIDSTEYVDDLWNVYRAAHARYKTADNYMNEHQFKQSQGGENSDYWGAFDRESGALIGYMVVKRGETHCDFLSSKYHPDYLSAGVSAALHHETLLYYLNECGYRYCSSGSRSINHETNIQTYLVDRFQYRCVYCKLNIAYRPGVGVLVKLMYPFRRYIEKINMTIFRQVAGVLKMEEIKRGCM